MSIQLRINSDLMLNVSGLVVSLFVTALSVYTVSGSDRVLWVLLLGLGQFGLFAAYLRWECERRTVALALFWLGGACILALYFLVPNSFVAILSIIWIVQAADLYNPRQASALLVASVLALGLSQLVQLGPDQPVDILATTISFGLFQVFALSATLRARREREQREHTAMLNRELLATRDLLSQTAAQSERLRIARDLHDILGHHMTAMILNLEVAKHKSGGEAAVKVEQSLAIAKLLLADLRSTVSELREQGQIDLEQSIRKLTDSIPKLEFQLDFSGAPRIKDVQLAETLLRCVQEGITNTLRHSSADRCEIILSGDEHRCCLIIKDNGGAGEVRAANVQPGNGLIGMLERIRSRGGQLHWQRLPEGFRLQAELGMESGS